MPNGEMDDIGENSLPWMPTPSELLHALQPQTENNFCRRVYAIFHKAIPRRDVACIAAHGAIVRLLCIKRVLTNAPSLSLRSRDRDAWEKAAENLLVAYACSRGIFPGATKDAWEEVKGKRHLTAISDFASDPALAGAASRFHFF
jgi:hypothetical protein